MEALQTVTQTISLVQRIDSSKGPSPFMLYDYGTQGILSHPNNPAQATPGTILNYTVRLYWDGTPPCTATVTTFCVPQPHVIPFDAIFPIQGIVFETGTVEVVLGQPATCGFCPNGVWQPWLGEQCDPLDPTLVLPDGSPNPCCLPTCQWQTDVVCDQSNQCAVRYCAADGSCQVGPTLSTATTSSATCARSMCACLHFFAFFFFPAQSFLARCLFRASSCVVRGFQDTGKRERTWRCGCVRETIGAAGNAERTKVTSQKNLN